MSLRWTGRLGAATGGRYAPRRPLESALHRGVSEGLTLFVAQAEEHEGVPTYRRGPRCNEA